MAVEEPQVSIAIKISYKSQYLIDAMTSEWLKQKDRPKIFALHFAYIDLSRFMKMKRARARVWAAWATDQLPSQNNHNETK